MNIVCKWAGILTVGFAMTGCATHNYDFASVTDGPARISMLVDDLDRAQGEEGTADEELYEISLVPLVHSHLHVFAEGDKKDSPAEYVEAEINSYLPLFGFVNGTVSQYDENQQLITRHDFDSSLWGAFGKHRELIATRSGIREKTRHRFLWLFRWWGEEKWYPADKVALGSEVQTE